MKHRTLAMMTGILAIACQTPRRTYTSNGDKADVRAETTRISFNEPTVDLQPVLPPSDVKEFALLPTVLTTLVDAGFSYLDSALKNGVKHYSSEFNAHQIYAEQSGYKVPSFQVERTVEMADSMATQVLILTFEVRSLGPKDLRACYYELVKLNIGGSRAKVKAGDRLDYTIEIKPTFIEKENGALKKTTIEIKPLQVVSAAWDSAGNAERKLRSEVLLIPQNAVFIEMDVKVTETNPRQVKAQLVLDQWTKHQDKIKEVVKEYVPKEEVKKEMKKDTGPSKDPNKPVGSD